MNVNGSRYDPASSAGLYESYYLRANHPDRPLALWIRYTLLRPAGRPQDAVGELWAIVFDGERGHVSEKVELPIGECSFAADRLVARVGSATLTDDELHGGTGTIGWDLSYGGGQAPLLLLPESLYRRGFPKAKSLVPQPLARFTGELRVGDRTIDVDGWRGSQNHNWGSRHTDRYAFGQVAGFDNAPDSFLEVATAKIRIGPLWMPALTPLVLRHRDQEYAFNAIGRAVRATASLRTASPNATSPSVTAWSFASSQGFLTISGSFEAPPEAFVHLRYGNPPGGVKFCHNTKLARCSLTIVDSSTGSSEVLVSEHGGLLEILDDVPGPD
jgi:hypothetical protein